jgi:Bacteriophage lambda head decoration protein D
MGVLHESRHPGEFMVSEANGWRSRDTVTIASGSGELEPGTVLGKITLAGAVAVAVVGNTGNGAIAAVVVGAGAKAGAYRVICIEPGADAGKFTVEDPDGVVVGVASVGVEFEGGGLTFTIADGATDFTAGDAFRITVAAGSGKYQPYDPANADGSGMAAGILYGDADATAADVRAVAILRDAEVNARELVWKTGLDAAAKATGLAHLAEAGIIAR